MVGGGARGGGVGEGGKQSQSLSTQLRSAHGGFAKMPLLGSKKASRLFERRIPSEVTVAMLPE